MRATLPRMAAAGRRGLTLLELMIGLAIIAVLTSLAVPSLATYLAHNRLKAAAVGLETDLREARYEAARRGAAVHLSFQGGPDWCYAIATQAGCDCRSALPCRLKAVRAEDARGVLLVQARGTAFDPATGMPDAEGAGALFGLPGGERVRVQVQAMGRPLVCVVEGHVAPLPGC